MARKVVVAGEDDALLLPFRWINSPPKMNLDHLFRPIDAPKVRAIVEEVMGRGFSTYVGGSVVCSYLFDGKSYAYSDVDIVASGTSHRVKDLERRLDASTKIGSPFDHHVNVKVEDEDIYLPVKFRVEKFSPQRWYTLHSSKGEELIALRYCIIVEEPKQSQVRPIDLILMNQRDLAKGFSLG